MFEKIKADGFTVEIRLWDFDTIDAEAIVNPTDGTFSGSGGVDAMIHKKAGKRIIHAVVPQYKQDHMERMERCYYDCIQEADSARNQCHSVLIPLLGVGSMGWDPKTSMHCAWNAILHYAGDKAAGYYGQDRIRKIVIACNEKNYSMIKEYRKNWGHVFLRTPEKWAHHGDLFFWEYLKQRLSEYTVIQEYPSAAGLLKIVARLHAEVTGFAFEKGKVRFAKQDGSLGKLSGMPIDGDFWLDTMLPLLLENYCLHMEELGLPPMDTVEVLIGNYSWTIPKDCEYYFDLMRGSHGKFVIKESPAEEKKLSLKKVGLKYSPAVEKALAICFEAHKEQKDNNGLPYVFHPFHLAEQMETEDEICAALLHDVVEDSHYTLDDLKHAGFNETVTEAVRLLTRDLSVPYMEYIRAIRKNKVARKVKLADLLHNSDPARKAIESEWEKKRARKYRIAKAILEDDPYDKYLYHYRKTIPLDDQGTYFLSVFYEADGIVKKYSLDVEKAEDTHIEFIVKDIQLLKNILGSKDSFPEAIAEFMAAHGEYDFKNLLSKCGVEYQVFHYGD